MVGRMGVWRCILEPHGTIRLAWRRPIKSKSFERGLWCWTLVVSILQSIECRSFTRGPVKNLYLLHLRLVFIGPPLNLPNIHTHLPSTSLASLHWKEERTLLFRWEKKLLGLRCYTHCAYNTHIPYTLTYTLSPFFWVVGPPFTTGDLWKML